MPRDLNSIAGFQFAGISAGIKQTRKLDLALIFSKPSATVVGAFTNNKVVAAPVLVSKKNIRTGKCSAIIINSGNANACTGRQGLKDAEEMVALTARHLGISKREILVCSTGKIGVPLPIKKIRSGIPKLIRSLHSNGFKKAAEAILTTDKGVKIAGDSFKVGPKKIHLIGMAKGAGMIEPHLIPHATMLAFFMTDLKIGQQQAGSIFNRCIDQSLNRITVDGDTSTNDCAFLLANGMAGNRSSRALLTRFEKSLLNVMKDLAIQMVEDGEGATKVVEVCVRGARNDSDARKVAYAIGNSPLVKTSFFGEDPNWGRVLAAAGRSGATLRPDSADIFYEDLCLFRKGRGMNAATERKAKQVMKKRNFKVTIDLHLGKSTFGVWASDLGLNYVRLNSNYRT